MNNRGFSLIELLVVMAIFLTVSLIVSDIFMRTSTTQDRALAGQRAINDLQYSLDKIADLVRTNRIDYSQYPASIVSPVSELNLLTSDGRKIVILKNADPTGCIKPATECVKKNEEPALFTLPEERALTSNQINVSDIKFFIYPANDPFSYNEITQSYYSSREPMVTIVLGGVSLDRFAQSISLQTSISSRYYGR